MDIDLDTGKLVVFIGGFALLFGLESFWGKRAYQRPRWLRLGFHAGVAAFNVVTIRVLAYVPLLMWIVYVEQQGWGLRRYFGLVGWAEIIVSIIVLDAFDYFWHRANHRVRFLWRFHKAHHSDNEMDVTTSLRFHPGELLISAFVKAGWILIWGPTAVAWFLFEALVSLCAQFHHANVDFPDRVERVLSAVIVTPRYHAAHHAVDRRWGDANFSTILSIWDRLFRTYSRPADGGATTNGKDAIGLPDARDRDFSPTALATAPFRNDNLGVLSNDASDKP